MISFGLFVAAAGLAIVAWALETVRPSSSVTLYCVAMFTALLGALT